MRGITAEGNIKTYISRPFLSAEQHRQLYDWVERSVFQTEPEKYEDFVLSALKAPEIQRLYDKKSAGSGVAAVFFSTASITAMKSTG